MKSCKKIVSCFLCIAILTSFLCVPASANDGIAGAAQDFFEWSVNWSQDLQDGFWKAIYGDSWMEDENGGWTGADRDELTARYNQYVSSLQTDLGTATLIDGGIRLYPENYTISSNQNFTVYSSSYQKPVLSGTVYSDSATAYIYYQMESIKLPFVGHAKTGYFCNLSSGMYLTTNSSDLLREFDTHGYSSVSTNLVVMGYAWDQEGGKGKALDYEYSFWVDLYPLSGSTLPTTQDITINSRPTSIVGDYGIIGDDGTIIKVDGNMIVDESTNTVFNPVTNVTNNYTDYAFDYSDRSYNLTLEDGSTLKVVYGDENIIIHEGDTIYNIYYLIPDDSGSGDEPGTGDDPGSGETPGGEDLSWWKEAWMNFTDKLFSILGNGGSSVNPDTAPAVPDDEETGEKGYSVIDLFVVLKDGTWAFITGIVSTAYDGFTGFVESVSSAGSFFTFYDEESEDGILFVPLEGGETIWD